MNIYTKHQWQPKKILFYRDFPRRGSLYCMMTDFHSSKKGNDQPSSWDEEDVLRAIGEGYKAAQLIAKTKALLVQSVKYAYGFLGQFEDAEDAVADTIAHFCQLSEIKLENRPLGAEAALKAYWFRSLNNRCLDKLRTRLRQPSDASVAESIEDANTEAAGECTGAAGTPALEHEGYRDTLEIYSFLVTLLSRGEQEALHRQAEFEVKGRPLPFGKELGALQSAATRARRSLESLKRSLEHVESLLRGCHNLRAVTELSPAGRDTFITWLSDLNYHPPSGQAKYLAFGQHSSWQALRIALQELLMRQRAAVIRFLLPCLN